MHSHYESSVYNQKKEVLIDRLTHIYKIAGWNYKKYIPNKLSKKNESQCKQTWISNVK